jgi:hypothetical protein
MVQPSNKIVFHDYEKASPEASLPAVALEYVGSKNVDDST